MKADQIDVKLARGSQQYHLLNEPSILAQKIAQRLGVVNSLTDYFTALFKKQNRTETQEEILVTDYYHWKLFSVMKKTSCWSPKWLTQMTEYLAENGYPAEIEIRQNGAQEKVDHFQRSLKSFGQFLFQISELRDELGLGRFSFPKEDVLSEKDVFERLDLDKNLDPDFGPESTYYVDQSHCLTTQSTPYYLKHSCENTLDYFKVFRRETSDSSHLCEFYQLEYVRKSHHKDPCSALIKDFVTIFRRLGLKTDIIVRRTRNNYTWPSFEFYARTEDRTTELVEIGNSGLMAPEVLRNNSEVYDPKAIYLAGAIGLERLYLLVSNKKHISQAKNDFYF